LAAGIATNTLLKWMKEPEFDREYRAARRMPNLWMADDKDGPPWTHFIVYGVIRQVTVGNNQFGPRT
jgi:hypothetical protein